MKKNMYNLLFLSLLLANLVLGLSQTFKKLSPPRTTCTIHKSIKTINGIAYYVECNNV